MFSNDILLLSKDNINLMKTISRIIKGFTEFFGLQVNAAKSLVFFSKTCHHCQQFLEIVGFNEGNFPLKYLGVPIIGKELRIVDCNPLLDQLQSYLCH